MSMTGIPIHISKFRAGMEQRICVGFILDGAFYTERDAKRHFFRIYNGFGLGAQVLGKLKAYEPEIVFVCTEAGKAAVKYRISWREFWEKAHVYNDRSPNSVAQEDQMICDIKHMKAEREPMKLEEVMG